MRIKIFASLALTVFLPVAAGANVNGSGGYLVNKDLQNLGPDAYDLAIVLEGSGYGFYTIDATEKGIFSVRTNGTDSAGNTVIHWQQFSDATDDKIDHGQTVHVGVGTDQLHRVVDMYWTDVNGRRIPGSVVYDCDARVTYSSSGTFNWRYGNANAVEVSIRNIRYAVLSQPLDLGQLTEGNTTLQSELRSLGPDVVLAPGQELALEVPEAVPAGAAVVTVYEVAAPGSAAVVVNYAEGFAN